jgi:hypothetical protein
MANRSACAISAVVSSSIMPASISGAAIMNNHNIAAGKGSQLPIGSPFSSLRRQENYHCL